MKRLLDIIAGLPTTLDDDRAALRAVEAASSPPPWARELLSFRVARKAALYARVAALHARAGAGDDSRSEL